MPTEKIKSFDSTFLFCNYQLQRKDKPTLIFIHGLGANQTVWKKEIDFFDRKKFPFLTYDLRGHGLSGLPLDKKKYCFPNFRKDLATIIKKKKINNFILIGHSFGGAVALDFTLFEKKPQALILIESTYYYPFKPHQRLNLNPLINYFIELIARSRHIKKHKLREWDLSKKTSLPFFLLEFLHFAPLKIIVEVLDNAEDYSLRIHQKVIKKMEKLNLPVLIIAGDKDKLIPLKISREMYHLIKSAKLRIVKSDHHLIIKEPKKVGRIIFNFLQRIGNQQR